MTARIFKAGAGVRTLSQYNLTNAGSEQEGFENTADWTVTNGSIAQDTTYKKSGTQAIEFTSAVGGLGRAVKTVSWDLSAVYSNMRIWCYTKGSPTTATITLDISSVTNFAKRFTCTKTLQLSGWTHLNFITSDWTNVGTESWSNTMIRFRVTITAAAGETLVVSVDNFRTGIVSNDTISIGFNDSYVSQFTLAFPYMLQHGMRADLKVTTSAIGGAGKLTENQIVMMDAHGWSIGNHTLTGGSLAGLSQAECEAEIQGAIDDLEGWGIKDAALHFTPPSAGWDANVEAACTALGILSVVRVNNPYNLIPAHEAYKWSATAVSAAVSLATVEGYVDTAITRGEHLRLGFHDLTTGAPAGNQWGYTDFCALIDYLVANNVPVITCEDVVALESGSLVIPANM